MGIPTDVSITGVLEIKVLTGRRAESKRDADRRLYGCALDEADKKMRPGLGDLCDLGGKDKIRQAYLRHLPTSPQRGSGWAVVFWDWKKGVPFDI